MNLNIDCIRDVLIYCANNIDVEQESDGNWSIKPVTLHELYESKLNEEYESKEIMYAVSKLYECHFIEIKNRIPPKSTYIQLCWIEDVTFQGHQFLESIKESSAWEKTKSIASRVGNYTLNFIEDTAQKIAVTATAALIAKL